jgi:hypothetical protein
MKVVEEFKKLVDAAEVSIGDLMDSPKDLCYLLGVEITDDCSGKTIIGYFIEYIKATLTPHERTDVIRQIALKDLQAELIYESIIDEIDNSVYLTCLKTIDLLHEFKPLSDSIAWVDALSKAKDLNLFSPDLYKIQSTELHKEFPKRYDIADAAKQLRGMGCEVSYDGRQIICKSGLKEVIQNLEDKIVAYGAGDLINAVFDTLRVNNCYYPEYRRYVIRNNITFLSSDAQEMTPYGYLLNLAVKHLGKARATISEKQKVRLVSEIDHLAKIISRIADARHYSMWEGQFQNPDTLLDSIRSYALFDIVYAFPCASISVVISYMENLFMWIDTEVFDKYYGYSIKEVIEVTRQIEEISADTGLQIIYTSSVSKGLKHIGREKVQKILDEMAHDPTSINRKFFFTEDYNKVNFGFKPLVKLSPTKFILCDKSWCAVGFYEVLATLVRALDISGNQSNIKIGMALEAYIKQRLREKGVNFTYGKYADETHIDGEADVIIEANDVITLIEVKKKVLTRRARTGSVVAALIDLASSLLDAQIQTGKTEILLREQGYICLENENGTNKVVLNQREVERMAITQWDFGSFQDRTVINNILSVLMKNEIVLQNQEIKSDVDAFKKIHKQRIAHEQQAIKLNELDPKFSHYPYFNCWFISVPQLLVVLDFSADSDEFYEALRSTRFVTMGTANFYFEFYYNFITRKKQDYYLPK